MTRLNLPITSREYKLMLNVDHFRDRKSGIHDFWDLVTFFAARKQGRIQTAGKGKGLYIVERRVTRYLDTPSHDLRRRDYVVRLRTELKKNGDKKGDKITLKYRSPDRYLSAHAQVEAKGKGDQKFEEDIVPPFKSRFSHSVSVEQDKRIKVKKIKDLLDIFPSLKTLQLGKNMPLVVVNDFKAHELVVKFNRRIVFDHNPDGSKAKSVTGVKPCLSFWYLESEDALPLVTEFSFDYDAKAKKQGEKKDKKKEKDRLEVFPISTILGTEAFFDALQQQQNWLNLGGTTKTAYAYDGF